MKLKKQLFDQLHAEKQKADVKAFNIQVAIDSLQNLCDHEWKVDESHGFPDDPPYCKICGLVKNEVDNLLQKQFTADSLIEGIRKTFEKFHNLTENRKDETYS